MNTVPSFDSIEDYQASACDVRFWGPLVVNICQQHGVLAGNDPRLFSGVNGTYPTFLCDDVVVKFFGHYRWWRKSFQAEIAAHKVLATDPGIVAPRLVTYGQLSNNPHAPWPYLVTTRMSHKPWHAANLSAEQKISVAIDLGRQIKRVQRLPQAGIARPEDWSTLDIVGTTRASSMPEHLTVQVEDYLGRLGPVEPAVVHGDLVSFHVMIEGGRLAGIIDWGDMMVTDRHYELAKLHLDLFSCDKKLLAAFLESAEWRIDQDFAQKALGFAIYRQAHCVAQHGRCDVFHKVGNRIPLQEIATLNELATELFQI